MPQWFTRLEITCHLLIQYEMNKHNYSNLCMHGCCSTGVGPGLIGSPYATQNGKKVYIRTSIYVICAFAIRRSRADQYLHKPAAYVHALGFTVSVERV